MRCAHSLLVAFVLVLPLVWMESQCSDAELVRQIATGGSETTRAEALLYPRFAARIELYGRRHLGVWAAGDLVQQVILQILVAIRAGRLRDPSALASFVLGTCRNVSWDTGAPSAARTRCAGGGAQRTTTGRERGRPRAALARAE